MAKVTIEFDTTYPEQVIDVFKMILPLYKSHLDAIIKKKEDKVTNSK